MPFLLVIAGPNGSGKTTLTAHLRHLGYDFGVYINVDDIVLELGLDPSSQSDIRRAQDEADRRRERCLEDGMSFSFETVMSHPSKVDVMRRAAALGYEVVLFFVATDDPTINVRRVEERVARGGHDVPRDRIATRYDRTLTLFPDAVRVAHRSVIFDNSATPSRSPASNPAGQGNGLRAVAEVTRGAGGTMVELAPPVPGWVDARLIDVLERTPSNDPSERLTVTRRLLPF